MFGSVAIATNCQRQKIKLEGRFFAQNVDEIVFTTKSTGKELLKKVNNLHKNFHFTLKNADGNGEMAFLDMNIYVSKEKTNSSNWYHKPIDTSIILNFSSCAPLQHM